MKNGPERAGYPAYYAMILLMTLLISGCGGSSAAPSTATEKSQMATKSIEQFVVAAKKRPKAAAQNLTVLMESLDAYANDHSEPFVELRNTAQELLSLYQGAAAKEKIKMQLELLQQKAAALSAG